MIHTQVTKREPYEPYGGFTEPGSVPLSLPTALRTKSGEEIDISVYETDPYDSQGTHRGWKLHLFVARIDSDIVGYLKVAIYDPTKDQLEFSGGKPEVPIGKPIVAWSDADPQKRQQHIGLALYISAATWLARRGQKLHSDGARGRSSVCLEETAGAWL